MLLSVNILHYIIIGLYFRKIGISMLNTVFDILKKNNIISNLMNSKTIEIKNELQKHKDLIVEKIRLGDIETLELQLNLITSQYQLPARDYDYNMDYIPYDEEVKNKYNLSKYVNASLITTNKCIYIAAQEPKTEMVDRFLELIKKSEINLVISLYDSVVYFKEEWVISRKTINFKSKPIFYDEIYNFYGKKIRRLRCIYWKDFDVLELSELNFFIDYFNKLNEKTVIIHCHGGVGRTGVFIAFDILKELGKISVENFADFIIELRSYRPGMIVGLKQWNFLIDTFVKDR